MKKHMIPFAMVLLAGFMFTGLTANAGDNGVDWQEMTTLLDKSAASGNMPDFINDNFATRGAGFNGDYVFVASRQGGGNFVYYWDVNDPEAEAGMLDLTGVTGGTFVLSDMTVIGDHIFVCNMTFAGGPFKLYHWDGIDAEPTTLISYNSPVRLGDSFSITGDPDDEATIYVSAHGGSAFYTWQIQSGQLVNTEPDVIAWIYEDTASNFARMTAVPGYSHHVLVSGPAFGPVLKDLNTGILTGIPSDFFSGWAMYAHVFNYEGQRFMAYANVRLDPDENKLYVLDLNDGDNPQEALENLAAGDFAGSVVHSVDIGNIANGNASVSVDVVIDGEGSLYIMAFAAGNGFIVQKIQGEGGDDDDDDPDPDPDPPVEVETLAELREKPDDGTLYLYTGNAVIVAMDDFRNRKFIQDETAAIVIDDNPGVITTTYQLYDVISNIEGRINIWNQLVRFQPTANTEASTENTPVEPQLFTLADVGTGDQAKLVKFEDVFITGASGTFMNGQNYTITDNETEFVLRTDFYNADYIGQPIPGANTPLHVTGVILQHQASMQIVPRFADDIVEQEEVGVIDAGITAVSIYPNPASSTVYIRTDMEVYGIRLIDMLGQVVYSASTGGHQLHVDVSHLNKGIYFIQLISDKGLFTERIHIAR